MGHWVVAAVVMVVVAQPQRPAVPSHEAGAAEAVTLKDGPVVRCEVFNPSDRGKVVLIVRRAWAEGALPEKAKAWEEFEAPWRRKATDERLTRLEAWRSERSKAPGIDANDALLKSIGRAIERLHGPDASRPTRLMMVAIDRREVARVDRQTPASRRMLRLGWRAGFADVETMEPGDLKSALEGRNFPVQGEEAPPIDDLLPLPLETEPQWRLHRAATEVKAERAGWFIRYNDMILADNGSGQGLDLNALGGLGSLGGLGGLSGLGDVTKLLRELSGEDGPAAAPVPPKDPLADKLRALAGTGRIGAVVTKLTIAPDLSGVTVEAEFWVNAGPGADAWQPAGKRSSQVSTDQIAANAGANLEADPQIKKAFEFVDGLGLGQVTGEMKQRALAMGAATQKALSDVRTAANTDLDKLALPLGEAER